ncbi:MAG: branched-chain amino acid ABC transporter permease [Promethearchaeota archaeon]
MKIREFDKSKLPILLFSVFVFALPLILSNTALWLRVFTYVTIFCILSSAMNLMIGFAGQFSLGVGAIAGLAAYTSANLMMRYGFSFWVAFPVAALTATALGVGLGFPGLRLRGFYFAMATLIMQNVIVQIFLDWTSFTKGDIGLTGVPFPTIFGVEVRGIYYAYLCLAALGITLYVVYKLLNSSLGMAMRAIREDDVLTESLGINVARTKMIVYATSSFMIGAAGSLLGHISMVLTPRMFEIGLSFQILVQTIVGGGGTIVGPLVGTSLLTVLPYAVRESYAIQDIINGILMIIVAISFKGGIYGQIKGSLQRSKKEITENKTIDEKTYER